MYEESINRENIECPYILVPANATLIKQDDGKFYHNGKKVISLLEYYTQRSIRYVTIGDKTITYGAFLKRIYKHPTTNKILTKAEMKKVTFNNGITKLDDVEVIYTPKDNKNNHSNKAVASTANSNRPSNYAAASQAGLTTFTRAKEKTKKRPGEDLEYAANGKRIKRPGSSGP